MMTPTDTMHTPGPVPATPPRWLLGGLAAVVIAAVAVTLVTRGGQPVQPVAPPPLVVDGDHIDIRADAPTWDYVKLATATVGDPADPAAVPGRVAFDEARAPP